jgi:hypothetical protein
MTATGSPSGGIQSRNPRPTGGEWGVGQPGASQGLRRMSRYPATTRSCRVPRRPAKPKLSRCLAPANGGRTREEGARGHRRAKPYLCRVFGPRRRPPVPPRRIRRSPRHAAIMWSLLTSSRGGGRGRTREGHSPKAPGRWVRPAATSHGRRAGRLAVIDGPGPILRTVQAGGLFWRGAATRPGED